METQKILSRPPVVVVLGHVDHGKTTLLDVIRKTHVASKEAGGITQSIGASVITTSEGRRITFIDTPGHAAFSQMRGRGAKVADIAVLVVASDDGVKPQTKEAIKHIQNAKIPLIIALTKTDLASSDSQTALVQLEKEELALEKRGGDVPWVEVSAKTGKGLGELLETISLVAEVNGLRSDSKGDLSAVVIEAFKNRGGCNANVIVRQGILRTGDVVFTDQGPCKIKSLHSSGGIVKAVFPGEPAAVLGFSILPEVGSVISGKSSIQTSPVGLSSSRVEAVGKDELGIFLKATNAGVLEAIVGGLPAGVVAVGTGVGDVFESDVLSAKAYGADVFAFEVKASPGVKQLAEAEGVKIFSFKIIYELFDQLKEIQTQGLAEILGKAEVIAAFPFNRKQIAGCRVLQGRIAKGDKLVVMRGEKEIGKVKAVSLKKQKSEVTQAGQGEEFGLLFDPQLDFTMGDGILAQK